MAAKSTYIRKHLEKPLKAYAKKREVTPGAVINEALEEKLKKEGFLDK